MSADTDATGSYSSVEETLERLNKTREELEELWAARKLKLDLCLQLRIFERDALEVCVCPLSAQSRHFSCTESTTTTYL